MSQRRTADLLFLVALATYAWFFAGGGWNQNSQFDLTRAIVERHTFAIDAYASNTGDVSYARGHVWSNKSPGLSWIGAIVYAPLYALERARGLDPDDAALLTVNMYLVSAACVALPGALIPPILFGFARRRGFDARWAAAVALAVAFATQLLPYATVFMLHVPSAALLLYAFTSEHRGRAGFAAALAVATNYLCAPALIAAAVTGKRRDVARYAAGAAAPLAALAAYHFICFGNPFTISLAHEDSRFLTRGAAMGIFQLPTPQSIYGVLVSPYRGVFFFAPLLLVSFLGIRAWWRDDRLRCAAALLVIVIFVAFNVSFNGWDGGFGVGGRYLVPVIPLLGIALLYVRLHALVVAASVVSFAINFTCTAVDPQPSGSIPRPLTQYEIPLLLHGRFSPAVPITPPWSAATFTGHTSVNRMAPDEPVVFRRHAPDSPVAAWASFNLGELLYGPGDARSLLPLAALIACGVLAVARASRKAGDSSLRSE